jgi:hypothetical protein
VLVVAVPLFLGRALIGRARENSRMNETMRINDSYMMRANDQRQKPKKRRMEEYQRRDTCQSWDEARFAVN